MRGGERIRLLIVDDHQLFRESLSRLLSAEPDFDVVGECGSAEEAVMAVRETAPDLVLLDFDLGKSNALDYLSKVEEKKRPRVLVLTGGVSDPELRALVSKGVQGVFVKQSSPAQLCQSIRQVMQGLSWLNAEQLRALAAEEARGSGAGTRFTQKEEEVLRKLLRGCANKEIADEMGTSESAVKGILQQLFSKTGVRTRTQLVRIALENRRNQD